MAGPWALATAALYLVLKSNDLPRPKIRLKKFGFSLKIVPATIAKKLPPQRCFKPLFIPIFNFSRKQPAFAFAGESGLHTRLSEKDRAQRLTRRNRGHFGWGRYLYPRTVLRGSETLRGQRVERRTLPLWGLGRGVLSKNAKSLRDSDALMRVAVPRRRGPAGLRNLFRFCRNCGFHVLCSGPFRVCEARGGITTLSALDVLLKRRTAACQNGSFAVF